MNRTREPAFRKAEAHLERGAYVAVVGPISRTWYRDQGVLAELFDYLTALRTSFSVISDSAFRHTAQEAARISGTYPVLMDTASIEAELFIESCALCIALGPRTHSDVRQASPFVDVAIKRGIPVLAIWPNGDATFVALEAAAQ
jgi:hypothetical protein